MSGPKKERKKEGDRRDVDDESVGIVRCRRKRLWSILYIHPTMKM